MLHTLDAGVLELVDEADSKSVVSDGVWVRVPPPAPLKLKIYLTFIKYMCIINIGNE